MLSALVAPMGLALRLSLVPKHLWLYVAGTHTYRGRSVLAGVEWTNLSVAVWMWSSQLFVPRLARPSACALVWVGVAKFGVVGLCACLTLVLSVDLKISDLHDLRSSR